MKRKFLIFLVVIGLVILFIFKGIPLLVKYKEAPVKAKTHQEDQNISITGQRLVKINISAEPMCLNMITNEQYKKCNKDNCDSTCEREGCKRFGLYYKDSSYSAKGCICSCLEENKLKKALNPGST